MDAPNALASIKSVLGKALPQFLARLPKLTTIGDVYSVLMDPSKGLVFKNLESQELTAFYEFASLPSIDQLSFEMFIKVKKQLVHKCMHIIVPNCASVCTDIRAKEFLYTIVII